MAKNKSPRASAKVKKQAVRRAAKPKARAKAAKPGKAAKNKWVYSFGGGRAEGKASMRDLLGGKGAGLAEMANLGLPVPPGFTITTDVCTYYYGNGERYPPKLEAQVEKALDAVGRIAGKKFGEKANPLLVSIRSGARASMPGMMDTVLNLGLNDETVEALAKKSGDRRFAYDSYRRFITMYSDVVLGLGHEHFEELLDQHKERQGHHLDTDLAADDWATLVERYKKRVKDELGQDFPQDPHEQLWGAIGAVFGSWMNQRAKTYRRLHNIPEDWGTAVNVQAMVFGNMGETSATGVAFTRNPSTGERKLYGEFLINAQGEDVVAGIRTPQEISEAARQEVRLRQAVDGKDHAQGLWRARAHLPQARAPLPRHAGPGIHGRAGQAVDAADPQRQAHRQGGLAHRGRARQRKADQQGRGGAAGRAAHARPTPAPDHRPARAPQGDRHRASCVAGSGLRRDRVLVGRRGADQGHGGRKVILVRVETSPEDIHGMHAAEGILTTRGGMTSHAAVVARGMGKPCVSGAGSIRVDYANGTMTAGGQTFKQGDQITVDGSTGQVLAGKVDMVQPQLSGEFATLIGWADKVRKLGVRANADTPADARAAVRFGAEGIGLCRTEHMFFEEGRIQAVREMILADDENSRRLALAKLLPMQRDDFRELFEIMGERPVTIRLLDPPLHEFLPHGEEEIAEVAAAMGADPRKLADRARELHEFNPMLGFRGCRIAIVYPEIAEMQARAIFEAAVEVQKRTGKPVRPEVMVPLIATKTELDLVKARIDAMAEAVKQETGARLHYDVGTMIELPRAALMAGEIAESAEFFSFGTNDLTQTTFGISRDDAATFLATYTARGILPADPFVTIDQEGVGELVKIGVARGRKVRPKLKVGICGEHGGDPASIAFCNEAKLDYVSCSPFRVPIARLAAAQAALGKSAASQA